MDRGDLRDVLYALKCNGSPLDTTLTWHGQKLTIALHISQGPAYMHSRSPKVIYRDLKSKNVLLNDAYNAKLSDFGVSRARPTTLGEHKSSPTNAPANAATFMTPGVGTSFWIAPEVLLGKEYDEQADVFSFGVVLSELDTDDYPYWNSGHVLGGQGDPTARRAQEQNILEKVARGSLRPTFYNDCPAGIFASTASCLDGRPEKRPGAAQVVCTLSELRSHLHTHDEYPQAEPEPDAIVTAGFLLNE
ncbi:hypothetical protein PsorP6_004083 [Peronosclerospora sorghi]|uniref:Uncharacterized protein n=1 Tax=Peronosclerospora sorghi TaxID=230839 RepID=A0ACC0VST9_9STRA|nr:hypothetical protein PsorP6_004083 [Peronosclerospora sorghi]